MHITEVPPGSNVVMTSKVDGHVQRGKYLCFSGVVGRHSFLVNIGGVAQTHVYMARATLDNYDFEITEENQLPVV